MNRPVALSEIIFGATSDSEQHQGGRATHDSGPSSEHFPPAAVTLSQDALGIIDQLKANMEQTDRRLEGIQDVLRDELKDGLDGVKNGLENVTRLMIKLHNHSARVGSFFHS